MTRPEGSLPRYRDAGQSVKDMALQLERGDFVNLPCNLALKNREECELSLFQHFNVHMYMTGQTATTALRTAILAFDSDNGRLHAFL